jgi:hypothetical protein
MAVHPVRPAHKIAANITINFSARASAEFGLGGQQSDLHLINQAPRIFRSPNIQHATNRAAVYHAHQCVTYAPLDDQIATVSWPKWCAETN